MSKKKKTMLVAAIVLGIAVLGLAAGVYAKYIASITGSGTATVATWAFKSENEGKADFLKCDLTKTYTAATLANGKIAPGTEGYCQFKVRNAQSDVGVDYTIVPTITNTPTNLKFYTDSTYQTVLTNAGISGHLNANDNTTNTETIYWKWEYETADAAGSVNAGDAADTTNGESPATMTMNFAISGVQVRPTGQ